MSAFADWLDTVDDGFSNAPIVRGPLPKETSMFREPCKACRGSGNFISYSGRIVGRCYKCEGRGFKEYRTSSATRANAAAKRQEKRDAWRKAHPHVLAWIAARADNFEFAAKMRNALDEYGSLTDNQLSAVERCIAADAERKARREAERLEREASAPTVSVLAIETAFAAARGNQIARPKLRLDTFIFKPAPPSGRNAGAIYVTEGEQYLGKVAAGKFLRVHACTPETEARVVAAANDPHQAAIAYGRRVGACSVCGRELTKHASIDAGIGPICASKLGWGR